MSCEYKNIGALTSLLLSLLKCRAACKECDCVPFCTKKLLTNIHFCMTTPVSEDRVVLHSSQVWGRGSTTHLTSITSERGFLLCIFVDVAFLEGLFRFKIRSSVSGSSLLFCLCSYSYILWSEPRSYCNSRGFPENCSKLTLLVFQVRSGSMHVHVVLKILKKSITPLFLSSNSMFCTFF